MSFFESIDLLPNDPIFFLSALFAADSRPQKVNLGVGVYNDAEGQLKVLDCVREAESLLLQQKLDKNYSPLDGQAEFIERALKLIFGKSDAVSPLHLYGAQTLGGTGALRIGAEFLAQNTCRTIYIPHPTWPNHQAIFTRAGLNVHEYPYYDVKTHSLLFFSMLQVIQAIPPGSAILFHACCHNPTGMDLTLEQWKEVSALIKQHQLIPFFDFAYQGFANDFEHDALAVRLFRNEGHEMLVAYSFSKNMGLYGERVGLLAVTCQTEQSTRHIASHVKQIIRGMYSMPPLHGARIAATILSSEKLTEQWQRELSAMRQRVSPMRQALVDGLLAESKDLDFSYLKEQKGLFSFCGLTPEQVLILREHYGIFMPSNGRINVAGLNAKNIDYVVKAISATLLP